jgi:hypothetical protein
VAKFPEPPANLAAIAPTVATLAAGTPIWRVYKAGGAHPTTWDQFRFFGPLAFRFDHHQTNPPAISARGILYAAGGVDPITTCLAEVFQGNRVIETTASSPFLAGFSLARPVSCLDLTGTWPTAAGASTAIHSGQKARARRWSQAIYAAYPMVEGLMYCSSMNANDVAFVLYERAQSAVGTLFSNRALNDPALANRIATSAARIGYSVI